MQWKRLDEPRPAKPLHGRSAKKLMLILYFDSQGVILADFVEGTVNSEVYVEFLRRMREAYRRKRPVRWAAPTIAKRRKYKGQTSYTMATLICELSSDISWHKTLKA